MVAGLDDPRRAMEALNVNPTEDSFDIDAVLFPDLHLYEQTAIDTAQEPSTKEEPQCDLPHEDATQEQLPQEESTELEGEEAHPPNDGRFTAAVDSQSDEEDEEEGASAQIFGYATLGGDMDGGFQCLGDNNEDDEEGFQCLGGDDDDDDQNDGGRVDAQLDDQEWTPTIQPDMKFSEFEAEVVRAARYGASLEETLDDDEWQEAEIVGADGEPIPAGPGTELPNEGHSASWKAPISEDTAEAVRAAMAGFTLPPDAAPAWANDIPEEQWMAALQGDMSSLNFFKDPFGAKTK